MCDELRHTFTGGEEAEVKREGRVRESRRVNSSIETGLFGVAASSNGPSSEGVASAQLLATIPIARPAQVSKPTRASRGYLRGIGSDEETCWARCARAVADKPEAWRVLESGILQTSSAAWPRKSLGERRQRLMPLERCAGKVRRIATYEMLKGQGTVWSGRRETASRRRTVRLRALRRSSKSCRE
jgi:hypothetical protein